MKLSFHVSSFFGHMLRFAALALMAACIAGCRQGAVERSEMYKLLLPIDTCDFRYVCLGHSMGEIARREVSAKPLDYSDELSVTYLFELSRGRKLLVDYYSRQLKNLGASKAAASAIAAIGARIFLEDEVETTMLYNELQAHYSEQYGLPNGSYGGQIWYGASRYTESIEVRLSLGDDKKSVFLNLVDTKLRIN